METRTRYVLREQFTTIFGGKSWHDVTTYDKESIAYDRFDSLTKHNPTHKVKLVKVVEAGLTPPQIMQ